MGFMDEGLLEDLAERARQTVGDLELARTLGVRGQMEQGLEIAEIGAAAAITGYGQARTGGVMGMPADALAAGTLLGAALFMKSNPWSRDLTMAGAGALASFADRMGRQFGHK